MRRSSVSYRQFRRRQTRVFRQTIESVGPGKRQEAADDRVQILEQRADRGIEIAKRVVGCVQAEVDAERQHQLDEASAGFTQLKDSCPENVGEDQAHEIEVLRDLKNKMR